VRRRGIATESAIGAGDLRRLADSYDRFFHRFDAAPVLIVNIEHLDPVARDADLELLVEHAAGRRGRREFFSLAR